MSSPSPVLRLRLAAERIAATFGVSDLAAVVGDLGDEELVAALRDAAEARNALDVLVAAASAEVGRRSTRELGGTGLAQRAGHRNATSLVQNIIAQSRADASRAIRAGEDIVPAAPDHASDGQASVSVPRWLAVLRHALVAGRVSSAQFHAVRTGLGEPPVERYPDLDPEFLPLAWAEAVEMLLAELATLPVEELRSAARIARDRLDPIGVTLRFEERFAARSFRAWIDENGQHHGRIVFDDDAAAWVHAILRAAMRPRRGPRFVDAVTGFRRP